MYKINREYLTNDSWLDSCLIEISDNFETLWQLCPKERGKVMVFGEKLTPRFQQSYIRDYTFSGIESKAIPLPSVLEKYLKLVNSIVEYGGGFNQVLANFYPDGNSYISSHADSTVQLIPDSPIVTITICQDREERTFRIRTKDTNKTIVKDIITVNGLFLVMGGKFQKEFRHEIVKINGIKGLNTKARISLTFRQFI